jgi:hypothetical protein
MGEGILGTLGPHTPVPSVGEREALLTAAGVAFSGAAGTTVLPASGAWTQSAIHAVPDLRRLTIEASYNAHASTTTGYAEIIVMLCSQVALPAIGDDVWFVPGVTDGAVTAGALAAGTIGSGSDYTVTASWGKAVYRPLVIQVGAALANSDKIRMRFDVDVTDARWFALQAREAGDSTNRGILNLAILGGI